MRSVSVHGLLDFADMGGFGAIAWDDDLCLIGANQTALTTLGLSKQPVGATAGDVLAPLGLTATDLTGDDCAEVRHVQGPSGPLSCESRRVDGLLVTTLRERSCGTAHHDLEIILEKLHDGVMVTDSAARVVSCNRSFRDLFGVGDDVFHTGMTVRQFALQHQDIRDRVGAEREALARERAALAEGRLDVPDGTTVRRALQSGRIIDVVRMCVSDGGAVLTARDVTDDALLQRESRYLKTMLDNMSDAVMMLDEEHRAIAFNQRMMDLYDVAPERVYVGTPVRSFISAHGDLANLSETERAAAIDERFAATVAPTPGIARYRRRLHTGQSLDVTRSSLPDGGMVLTVRDANADAELASQKEYLETTLDSLSDGVLMTDRDGVIINVNRVIYQMFRIDPSIDLCGMAIEDSIKLHGDLDGLPEDKREELFDERRQVATGAFHPTGNYRLRVRLPGAVFIDVFRTVLPDGGAVITVRDVTESAELARQKLFLETIIENLDEGVMMLDDRNRIQVVNQRMLAMLQLDCGRVPAGTHVTKFLEQMGDAAGAEVLAGATMTDRSTRMVSAANAGMPSFTSLGRVASGAVLETTRTALSSGGAILSVRDKTKSTELERQRQLFRAVVENIAEGVVLVNEHGMCELANPSFLALYGADNMDVTGKGFSALTDQLGDVLGLNPTGEVEAEPVEVMPLEALDRTGRVVRRLPTGRVIELTRTPLAEGGAVAMHRDVTAETERHQLLEEARLAAEDANRIKSDFIARVTHELRTPMHGVLGMAALLEQTDLTEKQRNCLDILARSGRHMVELIDGLLTISTLETGDLILDPQPIQLSRIVNHCVEIIRPRAVEKGLEISVHFDTADGDAVMADELRLTQIVTNLLTNAVKYTPEGSIAVHLQTDRLGEQIVAAIAVEDTGPGIPKDRLQAVFEKFYQMRTSDRAEGVGLGLAIAQSLTELMDGRLTVASEVGHGTTFTLTVPLDVQPPADVVQSA